MKIKQAAQKLQAMGGDEDTILAHINPQEAAMLKAGGGSGARNPKTGLLSFGYGGDFEGGADQGVGGSFGGGDVGNGNDAGLGAALAEALGQLSNPASGMGNTPEINYEIAAANPALAAVAKYAGWAFPTLAGLAYLDKSRANRNIGSGYGGSMFGGTQFAGPGVNEHGGDMPGGGSYVPSALGNATPGGLLGATTTTPPAPIYARPAFVPKFGRPRGLLSTGGQLRGFLGG